MTYNQITKRVIEKAIQRFRKEFVRGHGPVSNGDNYPTEAESWIEADPEMMEEYIYSVLTSTIKEVVEETRRADKEAIDKRKEELKAWLYGTIWKQYDTEETAEVVQEDVDEYFSDKWWNSVLSELSTPPKEDK